MLQLGFDIEYHDPVTQECVPWADPTPALLDEIANAPWKVVDVETTGLNPSSAEQNFTAKEIRRGVNPKLRLRVVSALYPLHGAIKTVAADFDRMQADERTAFANAALSRTVFNHNVGFDAYWLREVGQRRVMPEQLLDSMLITRVLIPEHPLVLARMANDPDEDFELATEARNVFIQERSGWSLADLALGRLRRVLAKDLQGPKNWCQPFLTQQNYDYATGDVKTTYELLCSVFGVPLGADIGQAYRQMRERVEALRLVEPQVLDVLAMREKGMPWSEEGALKYIATQTEKVARLADVLLELEPALVKFKPALVHMNEGISAELKQAVGEAFSRRGLVLDVTSKTGAFKVGEKDLRRARAQITEDAKALFDAWVGIQRAKKAAGMAREVTGFAQRSADARLHPNTGHGPVTGRLASSEPNGQQFPRDQAFRDGVRAAEGAKIVAADFSALDMRVAAALAIRAQREIFEAYMGDREVTPDVARAIANVVESRVSVAQTVKTEAIAAKAFKDWSDKRATLADSADARKKYFARYRELSRALLIARFTRCYRQVRERATAAGTPEWGSLRDAFAIAGMDIHSWTTLSMTGHDPVRRFAGMNNVQVAEALEKVKEELGSQRQTGKVGNLSLTYAMKTHGLAEAAAKNYNIHWDYEQTDRVRLGWLASYVEVDLWHAWTELNPFEHVYIPDPDYGGEMRRKPVYRSVTLGGRVIYAFGLNAALSYEDQSTGADILGTVMATLREQHPTVYGCIINQVHDEVVFEVPDAQVEPAGRIIRNVMVSCAEKFLMPFGVRAECSLAIGQTWQKD